MVMVDETTDPARIIGYHTLLMMQIRQEEIPEDKPKIKRGIPVILLGQLAVDQEFQGQGHGELLLMDVQARVHEISRRTGVRAMMPEARVWRYQEDRKAGLFALIAIFSPGLLRLG
jgi:GNAT superfamily N-acetyltransferase